MDTTVQLPRYDAPGWADRLDPDLLRRWNETIADIYQRRSQELLYRRRVAGRKNATLATPFFVLGPSVQQEGEVAITARWPADPLGAVNCVGQPLAKELDDHGIDGAPATRRLLRVPDRPRPRSPWTGPAEARAGHHRAA